MLVRELRDGQLNLRAASLVYTTLLSLVPALAAVVAAELVDAAAVVSPVAAPSGPTAAAEPR